MLKKIRNWKIEYAIIIFFLLQPFIDIYRTYFMDTISIGPIAIEEFINFAYIAVLAIVALWKIIKTKEWKPLLLYVIYFIIFIIYIGLHYWNLTHFNTSIYSLTEFSFISESYYILRAYLMPFVLLISIYHLGFSDHNLSIVVKATVLVIGGTIVLSNLLGISFASYSMENVPILGSIFSWPSMPANANFDLYTSKGFFYSANQISALLFGLSPLMIREAIKKTNITNVGLLVIQVIAMIMIGTKTAALGILLVIAAMMAVLLFLHILKLESIPNKKIIPILLIIILGGTFLYYRSPIQLKYEAEAIENEVEREEASQKVDNKVNINGSYLDKYLMEFAYFYYINEYFLEIYPASSDPDFWLNVIERDRLMNVNNRTFKVEIISRIVERNDNSYDKILGIGYTSKVPYTERDYIYQYFIFGIAGCVLLLAPYFAILIFAGIRIIRNYKKLLNLENCAIGLSLCCMLIIAYFSGHVYGMMINMLFIALYGAKLLCNIKEEKV